MRELVEALKPFAEAAEGIPDDHHDVAPACRVTNDAKTPGTCNSIPYKAFRRARAALAAYSVPGDVEGVVKELREAADEEESLEQTSWQQGIFRDAAALIERLAAERDEARGKALEEAAETCHNRAQAIVTFSLPVSAVNELLNLAEAIRAMKETGT